MNTEIIIYKSNQIKNGKFSVVNDYGWILSNPDVWVKIEGSISMLPGIASANMRQDFILTEGATYRIRFTMSNRTATAIVRVETPNVYYDPPSVFTGATHVFPVANTDYDVTFISDGNSLMFSFASTFDGTISNVSITEVPEIYTLDVEDDVPVPMNYNIDTILDLTQRKTTFSKSIVLLGTDNNNKAFDHIYKINSESLFNPNLKCRCVIKNKGNPAFEGILCLDEIEKTISNKIEKISYSVSAYGESLVIFERLADKTIKELDFSMYDHPFCEKKILDSWNNTINLFNGSTNNRDLVYSSPLISSIAAISFTDNYVNYNTTAYIEITFSSAHAFLEGDFIFLDTNNINLFGDNQCIGVTSSTKIVVAVVKWWTGSAPSVTGDAKKLGYLGIGPWYAMADNGKYQIQAEAPLLIGRSYYIEAAAGGDDFTNVGAANNLHGTWFVATGTTPTQWTNQFTILYQLDPEQKNLATHEAYINHWVPTDFIPQIFVYEIFVKMCAMLDINYDADILDTQLFRRLTMPLDSKFNLQDVKTIGTLNVGQEYMIYSFATSDDFSNVGASSNATGIIFTATGSSPNNWSHGTQIAAMVNMNQWLPGMKLKDFLLGLLNMFDLALIEDPEVKNLIHLKNRNDFFTNTIIDWTEKLYAGDPIKITLSNKILPTYYELKYKDSEDFYNTDYNADWGDTDNKYGVTQRIDRKYGDQPIFNIAEFATENNVIEVPWQSTVQAGPIKPVVSIGTIISQGIYSDSDKTLSPTFSADIDGTNIKRTSADKIFLIGIYPTTFPWTMNSESTPGEDSSDVNQSGAFWNMSFYPWCGHTDKFTSNCIVFGPPIANYSPILTPTKRSLYSKFWKRYIEELNNVNGKIIECSMILSIIDIYNIDFSKLYQIDDFVMKINKITDWNINGNGLCKVEFLLKNR